MKRFSGFVIKEFYHIFRDRRTLIILFGMPVVQMMLFGYIISNEIRNINIAVIDLSHDTESREITSRLLSGGYFINGATLNSADEIEAAFRQGKIREAIIFEDGFGEKLRREGTASVRVIADATDANTANLIVSYTTAIINGWFAEKNKRFTPTPPVVTEVRMLYNEELRSVFMFVPGTMAMILILISALMTSISIVREKELGTMEVLLVSPLRPVHIVIGKVTPYVLLSFVNALSIILLSYFVFDLPLRGNLLLLMGESMLYILMALSLGIFISTLTNNQLTAMLMSMLILMLPTILLSGFIFPIENLPRILQWL